MYSEDIYALSGDIKTVKCYAYSAKDKFGEITRIDSAQLLYFSEFDEKRNLIRFISFKIGNDTSTSILFKYDNYNNLIYSNIIYYDYDSNRQEDYYYKYTNGFCSEYKLVKKLNGVAEYYYRETYKYDSRGNKVESSLYDSKGIIKSKIMTTYDSLNQEIMIRHYDSHGNLERKDHTVFTYNQKNQLEDVKYYISDKFSGFSSYSYSDNTITQKNYSANNDLTEITTTTKNNEGKTIKEVSYKDGKYKYISTKYYNMQDEVFKWSTIYYNGTGTISYVETLDYIWKNGVIIKQTKSVDNIIDEIIEYYNDGKIKRISNFQDDGLSIYYEVKYDYYYDNKGNWIKQVVSENETSFLIFERDIKYF
jgi:hypothetical protein